MNLSPGQHRSAAAPEAPAQADPLEKLTRVQEELRLYDDHPIPAPWREAVKVAREAAWNMLCAVQDVRWAPAGEEDWRPLNKCDGELRAALAQLDSLGGGE